MKKVLSILLSTIVLLSHLSLTVGTHYCHNKAVESKIIMGNTHLGCGMEIKDESHNSPSSNEMIITNPKCCYNTYQIIQSTEEFVHNSSLPDLQFDFFIAIVQQVQSTKIYSSVAEKIGQIYTPPPLIEKDIQVLFQTFLN